MDVVGYVSTEDGVDGEKEYWLKTTPDKKLLTKDRTGKIGDGMNCSFSDWRKAVAGIQASEASEVVHEYTPAPQVGVPKPITTPNKNLKDLKKELMRRGAKNAAEALSLLNSSTGANYTGLALDEKTASTALVLLMQVDAGKESDDVTPQEATPPGEADAPAGDKEEVTPKPKRKAKLKVKKAPPEQKASSLPDDPKKLEAILNKLSSLTEMEGFMEEVEAKFSNGEITNAVFESLGELTGAKVKILK